MDEVDLLKDSTFQLYGIITLISSWGLFLFSCRVLSIWTVARRSGVTVKVGPMFLYVIILFAGLIMQNVTNMYARYLVFTDYAAFRILTEEPWWTGRLFVLAFSLLLIVGHMSYRWLVLNTRD